MGSFDPDHALAILLQARFNEEGKKERANNKENLPALTKKPMLKASLVDPEWETTDPCPDIHGLFVAFNERFFWGNLLGVEVKWSPQMTSCAGICVYEGRNGLCSVRLSAPLLKLRPRSDLIETLLHEMIHAYLFVTNNNRDRDGHGPEFHKHMYRINKEAGTNITVYHSFHAEVKVYQQHWWRCNGPCQYRAPFFGMVKRAKNRLPGPNDIWWDDHRAACGGEFIKVREPEDYKNKKKGRERKEIKSKDGKDIRNFFKKPTNENGHATATVTTNKARSNVFGFNDLDCKNVSKGEMKPPMGQSSLNRVVGFGDLSNGGESSGAMVKKPSLQGGHVLGRGTSASPKGNNRVTGSGLGRGAGRGGMLANRGGGTLVVTGSQRKNTPEEKLQSPNTKLRIDTFKVFSGSGFTLGGSSSNKDRSMSRLLRIDEEPKQKRQKDDEMYLGESSKTEELYCDKNEESDHMCKCLVCNESVPRAEMDVHLESCDGLKNVFNDSFTVDNTEEKEINEINKKYKITSCPVCALHIEGDINIHLDECLNTSGILNMFHEPPMLVSDSDSPVQIYDKDIVQVDHDSDVEIIESEDRFACPICGMRFGESKINNHVNHCLDSEDDL